MSEIDYQLLDSQLRALVGDETDPLAATCNFVALLYNGLEDVNWLGVYVLRGEELVLGPFQGKSACVRIGLGDGVCGTAASTLSTQRVDDVHTFPGHIVCDADSRSERFSLTVSYSYSYLLSGPRGVISILISSITKLQPVPMCPFRSLRLYGSCEVRLF